jgi:hypothetical protein
MAKEIHSIKQGSAYAQRVLFAIEQREHCLITLNERSLDMNAVNLRIVLGDLRLYTIEVVEQIDNWRKYLFSFTKKDKPVEPYNFTYDGRNYLLKIRGDSGFLRETPISTFFEFSKRSDPFLLYPT